MLSVCNSSAQPAWRAVKHDGQYTNPKTINYQNSSRSTTVAAACEKKVFSNPSVTSRQLQYHPAC